MVCFSETWTTDNSICNDSNFQIENYTVLYQVRESGRGGGLSIFVHKEVYSKPRTDLPINSNDQQSLCIKIYHKKDKSILFSVMYRPPNGDTTVFENFCKNLLSANDETSKSIILLITGIQRRSGKNPDISDHFLIVFTLNTCEKSEPEDKTQFNYKRIYREEQICLLKHELSQIEWNNIIKTLDNPNTAYRSFFKICFKTYVKYFPKVRIKIKAKTTQNSWIATRHYIVL